MTGVTVVCEERGKQQVGDSGHQEEIAAGLGSWAAEPPGKICENCSLLERAGEDPDCTRR